MEHVDCVIVGAGAVGLAIARALALAGREVFVLERNGGFGQETSSRNSEVIHSGLYHAPGSLKARFCLQGRRLLYDYCDARGIPYRRCGKLIVATAPGQHEGLEKLLQTGRANGIDDLRLLSSAEARGLEPAVTCSGALLSPGTGILDVDGYLRALLGDACSRGTELVLRTRVGSLRPTRAGIEVITEGEIQAPLCARWLINAAGLQSTRVAASIEGFPAGHCPRQYYAKGSYFSLGGRVPFTRLIYPLPEPGALGVHLTLDLAGRARFGPDIEWLDAPDYRVDPQRVAAFIPRIRAFWPDVPINRLSPAYAGVRPKLSAPGEPAADFRVDSPSRHGVPGVINLFGIESPGLTASLAIARYVAELINSGREQAAG